MDKCCSWFQDPMTCFMTKIDPLGDLRQVMKRKTYNPGNCHEPIEPIFTVFLTSEYHAYRMGKVQSITKVRLHSPTVKVGEGRRYGTPVKSGRPGYTE
jgi:hypothetical protein